MKEFDPRHPRIRGNGGKNYAEAIDANSQLDPGYRNGAGAGYTELDKQLTGPAGAEFDNSDTDRSECAADPADHRSINRSEHNNAADYDSCTVNLAGHESTAAGIEHEQHAAVNRTGQPAGHDFAGHEPAAAGDGHKRCGHGFDLSGSAKRSDGESECGDAKCNDSRPERNQS